MTIAEANVTLRLAMPQGWTKEEVQEELNDILTALEERTAEGRERLMLEFEVQTVTVDANPFEAQRIRALTAQMPAQLPVLASPFKNTW